MEDGIKQAATYVVGRGETLFQLVAERHQFIDLGDDAKLFGEWRERDEQSPESRKRNSFLCNACCTSGCLLEHEATFHCTGQEIYVDQLGRTQYSNVALNTKRPIIADNDGYSIRTN